MLSTAATRTSVCRGVARIITGSSALPTFRPAASQTVFALLRHAPVGRRDNAQTFTSSAVALKPQPSELPISSSLTEFWPHPVYTEAQMNEIKIAHRNARGWSDYAALTAVRLVRWFFDRATGYKHDSAVALGTKDPGAATQGYAMSEGKWLTRLIFLESIAGVPGMVGGMVRHLQSLRVLRRDNGWIATLLEESQNERMHLLTFLEFRQPGLFMRLMILGAQGMFFNFFFVAYLLSPRTCHRFVGYLEEEAVITYSRILADLDAGKLSKWDGIETPQLAKDYFKLEPGKDGMRELLQIIRADEAKHREVNHTLANLEQKTDPNPYAACWMTEGPRPSKDLVWVKGTGWEREELQKIAKEHKVKQPVTS